MGRLHMQQLGFNTLSKEEQQKLIEEAKPHMWKSFLGQFILSACTSFFLATVVTTSSASGLSLGMIFGYGIFPWFCFIVPVVGSSIIWGNVDRAIAWKKFIADTSSYLVTIIAVILIALLFQ